MFPYVISQASVVPWLVPVLIGACVTLVLSIGGSMVGIRIMTTDHAARIRALESDTQTLFEGQKNFISRSEFVARWDDICGQLTSIRRMLDRIERKLDHT